MGEERKLRTIALPSHPDNFEKDEERRKKMLNLWTGNKRKAIHQEMSDALKNQPYPVLEIDETDTKPCPKCGGDCIDQLRKLLKEPLGEEWAGKPFSDLHKRIQELMHRSVWTHELAYPDMLLEEAICGKKGEAFGKSLTEIAKTKSVIICSYEGKVE